MFENIDKGLNSKSDFRTLINIGYNSKIVQNKRVSPIKQEFIRIKKYIIENLDELVAECIDSLKDRDCNVFLAKTKEEALNYILNEVKNEEIIVKSKTETGKEIGLNKFLEKNGFKNKVIETDMGDRIIQLLNEQPSIPMGPAVHINPKDIADKLSKIYGINIEPIPQSIVKFGREQLRKDILNAKVSITGANVLVADEGIIGLIENEGNISLITRLVDKHICLTGIDKIVKNWYDAITVLKMAEASLDLQGAYVSFIKGPSRTADIGGVEVLQMHGAKEVHVVLLDDYRSKIKNTPLEQVLQCINCGRCFLSCPLIKILGLNILTSEFSRGPIGLIKTYLLAENGLEESVKMGLFLCTSCKRCELNCPSEINIPEMIIYLKNLAIEAGYEIEAYKKIQESILEYDNPFNKKILKKISF